jgi:hypothetical protein
LQGGGATGALLFMLSLKAAVSTFSSDKGVALWRSTMWIASEQASGKVECHDVPGYELGSSKLRGALLYSPRQTDGVTWPARVGNLRPRRPIAAAISCVGLQGEMASVVGAPRRSCCHA